MAIKWPLNCHDMAIKYSSKPGAHRIGKRGGTRPRRRMIAEGHAGSPAPRSQTNASAKSIKNNLKHTENHKSHKNVLKIKGNKRNVIKKC